MGEYWAPCNMTKRERYCPIGTNKTAGVMTPEFTAAVLFLVAVGRWEASDEIRMLSDYGLESPIDRKTFVTVGPRVLTGVDQDEWNELTEVEIAPRLYEEEIDDE